MSDQNTILPDILTNKTKIFILSTVQCKKGGTTIKILPAMCEKNDLEEHLFIFLKDVSNDEKIYIC